MARASISARDGIARPEFEYEIPVDDAEDMLANLCLKPLLQKTRYEIEHAGLVWEVDVFTSPAEVVLAEVELDEVDQPVEPPAWVGREVTDDPRYRSAMIAAAGAPATEGRARARASESPAASCGWCASQGRKVLLMAEVRQASLQASAGYSPRLLGDRLTRLGPVRHELLKALFG